MHETYSQIFRNVCIVFIHVCVCLYTESHRREGRRQKDRDSRDMVNETKYWQRNLHIRFMVLPSISFHKFTYCEMNTFYKYTIHFFFLNFTWSLRFLHLKFTASLATTHRPQKCAMQLENSCLGFWPSTKPMTSAHWSILTLPQEFTKRWRAILTSKNVLIFLIVYNIKDTLNRRCL